jgi:vitamin K-dependent gamma-carboxylase
MGSRLCRPVDGASLAVFRIAFGALLAFDAARYLLTDRVGQLYVGQGFHFSYPGLAWVRPWPGNLPYAHFALLGTCAMLVAVGWRYRASSIVLWLLTSTWFLWERAKYQNHEYLLCLFALLLACMPAERVFSLDAGRRPRGPWVPAWSLDLLRFQVAVPHVFGGLAKLNGDWLRGEPMGMWLSERSDIAWIGPLLVEPWAPLLFSYGGLALDLLLVPALLWRRTRAAAFIAAVVFHVMNAVLFEIAIFPWLMIAASTIYFEPGWPRRAAARLRLARQRSLPPAPTTWSRPPRALPALLAAWVLVQALLPLRHHLTPGNASWTDEGHEFAWHMKLRDKSARVTFVVIPEEGGAAAARVLDPSPFLNDVQLAHMAIQPALIRQFARHVAESERARGREVAVHADVRVSLNGRPFEPMIDLRVDLAAEHPPEPWILPSTLPLRADAAPPVPWERGEGGAVHDEVPRRRRNR